MIFQSCSLVLSSLVVLATWGLTQAGESTEEFYDQSAGHNAESYAPQPYDFGYKVVDEYGNSQFRQEKGDGSGSVTGSYGYTDKLGIYRKVVYVADKWGYRANIQTNEPGTASQNPAAVHIDSQATPFQYGAGGYPEGSELSGAKEVYTPEIQEVKETHSDYQVQEDQHYPDQQDGFKRGDTVVSASKQQKSFRRKPVRQ